MSLRTALSAASVPSSSALMRREAHHVGREDRTESALDAFFGHVDRSLPVAR